MKYDKVALGVFTNFSPHQQAFIRKALGLVINCKKYRVIVRQLKDHFYRSSGGIFLISLENTACTLSLTQQ